MRRKTIPETFDEQYRVDVETGCWIWLRSCKGKEAAKGGGYGCFRLNGKTVGAHKFSYERVNGEVPKGLQVLHACHNTKCVNPAHLSVGTNLENQQHAARDLRRAQKLTPDAVRDIKKSCASGVLQRVMAAKYRIAQGDVSHILAGHWWAHVA